MHHYLVIAEGPRWDIQKGRDVTMMVLGRGQLHCELCWASCRLRSDRPVSTHAKYYFEGHTFKYHVSIWIESGRTMKNDGNVYMSGKKNF